MNKFGQRTRMGNRMYIERGSTLDKFWKFCWLIRGTSRSKRKPSTKLCLRHYGLPESYCNGRSS